MGNNVGWLSSESHREKEEVQQGQGCTQVSRLRERLVCQVKMVVPKVVCE